MTAEPIQILLVQNKTADLELLSPLKTLTIDLSVAHAFSVEDAAEFLSRNWADVIALDLTRVNGNGSDVFRRMQAAAPQLPIVVVIEQADETLGQQVVSLGARDYLVQGTLDYHALLRLLGYATERREKTLDIYRNAVAANPSGVMIVSAPPDSLVTYVNPAFERMTGYTAAEAIGRNVEFLHGDDHDQAALEEIIRAVNERRECVVTLRNYRKNGEMFWSELRLSPVFDSADRLVYTVGVINDVTEKRRAEQALRESEERFSKFFHAGPTAKSITSLEDGAFLEVNDSFVEQSGYSREELIGHSVPEVGLWADPEQRENRVKLLLEQGFARAIEIRFRRKNGEVRDALLSVVLSELNGKPCVLGSTLDITERKNIERAEREQRALAEALSDTAAAISQSLDLKTVMQRVLENVGRVVPHDGANLMLIENDIARAHFWLGYPESFDRYFVTQTFPLDMPGFREMILTREPNLIPSTAEAEWVEVGSVTSWIQSYVGAPIVSRGQVIGFINLDSVTPGFFTEKHARWLQALAAQAATAIENARLYESTRHYAETLEERVVARTVELHRAKEHVEAILNNSSDAIVITGTDGRIRQINPAFSQMFGYEPADMFRMRLKLLAHIDGIETLVNAFEDVLLTEQPCRIEVSMSRRDGTSFDADVMLSIFRNDSVGVIASFRDISERKQMERELRRALEAEKELADLRARFISIVSHEFRNPLAVIMSSNELLMHYGDRMSEEDKQNRYAKTYATVKHMTSLLEDVLQFSRGEAGKLELSLEPADIQSLCREVIHEVASTIGADHKLVFAVEGDKRGTSADPKLVRQILTNLLSNAVKYSQPGVNVYVNLAFQPEQFILSVRDEGIGIPEQDQKRLFEAFHRASNVGSIAGTGLGLAIIKQSVDLYGGSISFESIEGSGTTFTVALPLNPAAPAREAPASTVGKSSAST